MKRIRVFLSSTFADLQAERDYLVRHTFPSFSRLCRKRYIDFSVVDLRWGVTEEEAHTGKVMEICIDEIDNTKPFFIGLIGGRYGWIPGKEELAINQRITNKHPWIKDAVSKGMSMTEMEIRHGVLEADDAVHAQFYLKRDRFIADQFAEKPGSPEYTKLQNLKDEIRKGAENGTLTCDEFSTPEELGERVYDRLRKMLDSLYPEEQTDYVLLEQEAIQDELTRVFHNREALWKMDDFSDSPTTDETRCALIYGPKGSGKSALLANWAKGNDHVVYTAINGEINTLDKAIAYFQKAVSLREATMSTENLKRGWIFILDGMDRLNIKDCNLNALLALDAVFVFSSADPLMSNFIQVFLKDNFSCYHVRQMQKPNTRELVEICRSYLKQFGKGMTNRQYVEIVNQKLFSDIRLLQIFLNEIIQFGEYEKLDAFIDEYLQCENCSDFMNHVFGRLENEYGTEPVRKVLSMIALSQIGLPEEFLQQKSGLNAIEWAAFMSSISAFIIWNNRLADFEDAEVKSIAARRYIEDKEMTCENHQAISLEYHRLYKSEPTETSSLNRRRMYMLAMVQHRISLKEKNLFRGIRYCERIQLFDPEIIYQTWDIDQSTLNEFINIRNYPVILYLGNKDKQALIELFLAFCSVLSYPIVVKALRERSFMPYQGDIIKSLEERFVNQDFVEIEIATWEDQALTDISTRELYGYLLDSFVYNSDRKVLEQVETTIDNVIRRVNQGQEIKDYDYSVILLCKAFCHLQKNELKEAALTYMASVTRFPYMYNNLFLRGLFEIASQNRYSSFEQVTGVEYILREMRRRLINITNPQINTQYALEIESLECIKRCWFEANTPDIEPFKLISDGVNGKQSAASEFYISLVKLAILFSDFGMNKEAAIIFEEASNSEVSNSDILLAYKEACKNYKVKEKQSEPNIDLSQEEDKEEILSRPIESYDDVWPKLSILFAEGRWNEIIQMIPDLERIRAFEEHNVTNFYVGFSLVCVGRHERGLSYLHTMPNTDDWLDTYHRTIVEAETLFLSGYIDYADELLQKLVPDIIEESLAENTLPTEYYFLSVYIMIDRGKYNEAIEYIDKIMTEVEDWSYPYYRTLRLQRIYCMFLCGRVKDAIRWYKDTEMVNPSYDSSDSDAIHYIMVEMQLFRITGERARLEQLLDENPEDAVLLQKRLHDCGFL